MLDRLDVDVDVGGVLTYSDGTEAVMQVDHRAHDGMSAVGAVLTRNGYVVRSPARLTAAGNVRLREWPGIWARFRRDFRDRKVRWREERPSPGRLPRLTPADRNFGWMQWDEAGTAKILASCEARGISVNALLLWGLLRAVRPLVDPADTDFPWILPVDLRRRGLADAADAVATSGVMLDLSDHDTPEQVQEQMRRKVKERTYLAYWWVTERLPTLLPRRILWPVLRNKELGGNRCMGGCTYLGDLSSWVVQAPADRTIVRMVPFNLLSRQFPVQAVGLTWDGRLTFSLRIHPCMWADDVAPLVEAWKRAVEDETQLRSEEATVEH